VESSAAEAADNVSDVVFLKQTDGGDSCGTSVHALAGVFQREAAQSQHGDGLATDIAQGFESSGPDMGSIPFPKYRGEDDEVCAGRSRASDFLF